MWTGGPPGAEGVTQVGSEALPPDRLVRLTPSERRFLHTHRPRHMEESRLAHPPAHNHGTFEVRSFIEDRVRAAEVLGDPDLRRARWRQGHNEDVGSPEVVRELPVEFSLPQIFGHSEYFVGAVI